MSGSLVSDYSVGDSNIDNVMLTLDKAYKGMMRLSLTEYDTAVVPAIEAGSWVGNNGALFKFDAEEAISTTDPVTSTTVVDGKVWVCLIPDSTIISASFTATEPTWSGSRQGWYGTGDQANYRHVAKMLKSGTSYTLKAIIDGRDYVRKQFENINDVWDNAAVSIVGYDNSGTYSFVQDFDSDVESILSSNAYISITASTTAPLTLATCNIDSITISGTEVTTVVKWAIYNNSTTTYTVSFRLSLNTSIVGS